MLRFRIGEVQRQRRLSAATFLRPRPVALIGQEMFQRGQQERAEPPFRFGPPNQGNPFPASGRKIPASNPAHHAGFPPGGECKCKGEANRRGKAFPTIPPPGLGFAAPPPTRQHSNASGQIEPGQRSRFSDPGRTGNAAHAFHSRTGTKFQTYRRAESEPGGHVDRLPTCSSCLSAHFLPDFALGPRRWCELFNLGDPDRWQTYEQILQIFKWVDPVPPTTVQRQRLDPDFEEYIPLGFHNPARKPVFRNSSGFTMVQIFSPSPPLEERARGEEAAL